MIELEFFYGMGLGTIKGLQPNSMELGLLS